MGSRRQTGLPLHEESRINTQVWRLQRKTPWRGFRTAQDPGDAVPYEEVGVACVWWISLREMRPSENHPSFPHRRTEASREGAPCAARESQVSDVQVSTAVFTV